MKLMVISHFCSNPVAQHIYAEVERQTNWKITIVTPRLWVDEYGNPFRDQRWPEFKGEILRIPVLNPGNPILHVYRSLWVKILRQVNPDFIYLYQEPYALVTFPIYLANYLSVQKPIGFFTWQNIYKRYPFPFRQFEKWVLDQTTLMFCGSQGAEEVFRQKGYVGKSLLHPSGIDPAIYFPQPEAASQKQTFCDPDQVLIGYVGRFVEEKGLKTLLNALAQLQDLPWRLLMVGRGVYEAEFDHLAQQLQLTDRICRIGYLPESETPNYFSMFDIVVLPSETRARWKEQFGRVIIEAMACGTPVVGSDSGEIPNLIRRTGGGVVFQEGQPDSLAQQLRQMITNHSLRSQLAQQGRQSVLANYTHTVIAQRFAEAIEKTVAAA